MFVALFAFFWHTGNAQTVHLVAIANTFDDAFPEANYQDYTYIRACITSMANDAGMAVNRIDLKGHEYTLEKLRQTLQTLPSASNDVIFIYFSGNGTQKGMMRLRANATGSVDDLVEISLDTLLGIAKARPNRLVVAVVDNMKQQLTASADTTWIRAGNKYVEACKQLFLYANGMFTIQNTGASFTNERGALFTKAFTIALEHAEQGMGWKGVATATEANIAKFKAGGPAVESNDQTQYRLIDVKGETVPKKPVKTLTDEEREQLQKEGESQVRQLQAKITRLASKAIAVEMRRDMVASVLQMFINNGEGVTIEVSSRQGKTMRVREYPIKTYLNRLMELAYARVEIKEARLCRVSDLIQKAVDKDGNPIYAATAVIYQSFSGYNSEGKLIYEDETIKTFEIEVRPRVTLAGKDWEVRFGDIKVENTVQP